MPIINPLPFTLVNGVTADATQVMANFNAIVANVNANAAQLNQSVAFSALTVSGATALGVTTAGSLSLTTPLPVASGGTGANSINGAYPNLLLSWGDRMGFSITNNAGDATNDIDIGAGSCLDSTRAIPIVGAAMTKRKDAAWAAGTNNGAMFTGTNTSSSTTYHYFVIRKDSDGSVDYGISANLNASDRPVGYTYYRRIWSFKTTSGNAIPGVIVVGKLTMFKTPLQDIATAAGTSAAWTSFTLALVPGGLRFLAFGTGQGGNGAAGGIGSFNLRSNDFTYSTPANDTGYSLVGAVGGSSDRMQFFWMETTNASGQLQYYNSAPTPGVYVVTNGYMDVELGGS